MERLCRERIPVFCIILPFTLSLSGHGPRGHTQSHKHRDWSLITGKGMGVQHRRGGGHEKFTPRKRGKGTENVLAMMKWGKTKFFFFFFFFWGGGGGLHSSLKF